MSKRNATLYALAFIAVGMMVFACISVDDSSDAIVIDKMTVEKGETYSEDVTITDSFIVQGTYSGTLTLRNGTTNVVELSFTSVSGFEAYVNSGSSYISGNITSGTSTGSVKLVSGSIILGYGTSGFTGIITADSGEVELSSVVDLVATLTDSELTLSGDVSAASDVGFATVASMSISAANSYTGNETISISGILNNEILGNSIEVLSKSSNTYQLRGTLNYIDRNGGSAASTLFNFIVGDLNECTHAIIVSTSSDVATNNNIISLGGGKYLVCIQSGMDDSIVIGGKTISFAGLVMGDESTVISPSLSGYVGSITILKNTLIGDLTVGQSVTLVVSKNAAIDVNSKSDIIIKGSLDVIGTADITGAGSFTTEYIIDEKESTKDNGTIVSRGYFTISSSNKSNVYGAYYTSGTDHVFTSLSNAVNKQTDGNVYIYNSYALTSNLTVGSSVTIINNGSFYIDKDIKLINNGTFINNTADSGLIVTYYGQFNSSSVSIQNSGYVMAYGLFTNKGSFSSKVYADISSYNNTTTKLACLPVMLANVSSGDLTLYRDVDVTKDSEIPAGVTLYVMGTNDLTICSGATVTVNGTLKVTSSIVVEGTISVPGTMTILDNGLVTVNGSMIISGTLDNSGAVSIEGTLQIGTAPSRLPYTNKTVIIGTVDLGNDAIAIVYGNVTEFDPLKVLGYTESTVFYFESNVYATEYASASDVKVVLLTPKITGKGFAQWLDKNDNTVQGVHYIGDYDALYADITTSTYTVTLAVNEGIVWVLDDVTDYGNGGTFQVAYGSHYLTIKVQEGYSGTPTILRVTSSGSQVVEQGKEFMIVEDCEFKVEGVHIQGNGDGDNGLVMILVGIIITAIVLIVVMMFLLVRKKNRMVE